MHVLTQAQRRNKDVLIVLNATRTWILLQRDEEVSYADKHRIVYFLKVVSELFATLYFKFNVANVKQLWKALCPAVCRYDQCCRQSLRIALVQLQSLVLGCERLMFAKFNSQGRNKLRFLSAVCSEWNVLLSAKLRSYRQLWPPFTPGFAESKLRDLTVPRVNDVGSDNLLDSISSPASLWRYIGHWATLGTESLPRPLTDLELNLAMTQASTPTSASFPCSLDCQLMISGLESCSGLTFFMVSSHLK